MRRAAASPAGVLFIAGAATLALGWLVSPERASVAFLSGAFLLLTLGLGGLFFVALEQITGASWSASFRRVPEAMAATLPRAAAVMAVALAFALPHFPWLHDGHGGASSPLWFKQAWLSPTFFAIRAVIYLGVWVYFAKALLERLRRHDRGWSDNVHRSAVKLSAAFVVAFGATFCLASFDWAMSWEPQWFSTIFGVYNFAGLILAALCAITILAVRLAKQGPLRGALTAEHLHDLGKLIFAFSSFWMYIWFSQYMLIWYANIPEETEYYLHRLHGSWTPLFLLNLALNWIGPFLALLSVRAKRDPNILVKICWVILAGRCVDLYLMFMPTLVGDEPRLPIWEAAAVAAAAGGFLLLFRSAFRLAPAVPVDDPRVAEALHYHN